MLAKEANIDISQDEDYKRQKTLIEKNNDKAKAFYFKQSIIEEYLLKKRGLTKATAEAFYLGYDNSHGKAIVIPLHDKNGRVIAFCRRFLDKTPKYMNSRNNELYDKSEYLFNECRARSMLKKIKRLYIVEGYMDCMSAYQQGLSCVAYCGSELTKGQINEIKEIVKYQPNTVIMYAPDNDEVGQSKIPRVWEKFKELAPKLDVRVVRLPKGIKDFNEFLCADGSIGELPSEPIAYTSIMQLLDNCVDVQQEYSVAADNIRNISNPMEKADIVSALSKRWNKAVSDVKELTNLSFVSEEVINEFKTVDDGFSDYLDLITSGTTGIGFPSVDSVMELRPSDVVFYAGYSGTFKTMIAVEVALHNAIRLNKNVLIFSLEMSAGSFYERIIARIMKKSIYEIKDMVKNGQQAVILQKIKDKLKEKILIIDKSNLSIQEVEQRIALANSRMWKNGQTDFVILDYFQYLRAEGFDEQAATAKYTKVIAKKFNIIFFILSQLNRTGDNYKKPTIKMLKGTGDLEASGDYVCLAWTPSQDPELTADQYMQSQNHICMTIGKARRGARATEFELEFHPENSTITDLMSEGNQKEVDDGKSSIS
jgi:DNA primase